MPFIIDRPEGEFAGLAFLLAASLHLQICSSLVPAHVNGIHFESP